MRKTHLRRWLASVMLAFMAASAAYSLNLSGVRDRFPPPAATAATAGATNAPNR